MKFSDLRHANITRQKEWPGNDQADIAFRGLEVAGEFGEVAEALKKYLRAQRGIKGSTATLDDVASEMADSIIALDLLADLIGVDLGAAVASKFNKTSEKYGLATRMPENNQAD
ncbi:MAG: MazG-like family protein [Roseibium sp.]